MLPSRSNARALQHPFTYPSTPACVRYTETICTEHDPLNYQTYRNIFNILIYLQEMKFGKCDTCRASHLEYGGRRCCFCSIWCVCLVGMYDDRYYDIAMMLWLLCAHTHLTRCNNYNMYITETVVDRNSGQRVRVRRHRVTFTFGKKITRITKWYCFGGPTQKQINCRLAACQTDRPPARPSSLVPFTGW